MAEPAPSPEPKTLELLYFEAGCKFFEENSSLLGRVISDASQQVGELHPEVQGALDGLAIATAGRMAAIMRQGPQLHQR